MLKPKRECSIFCVESYGEVDQWWIFSEAVVTNENLCQMCPVIICLVFSYSGEIVLVWLP